VAVVAAICVAGAAATTSKSSRALGTFIVRNAQDWQTFDAYVDAGRATNFAYISPGYDKLVSFGPKGGSNYVPYLATSWKATAKSITFKVRQDAVCTDDGHKLSAQDMADSINRFLTVPKRSGAVGSNPIGGFGQGPWHVVADNKAGTLTFSVDHPWRNLLGSFAQFPIICPYGLHQLSTDPHYLETHISGSGPYTLVSANHNDQVVWKIRPEWNWGPPGSSAAKMPSTFIMKVVADDTTAANLLLTGGLSEAIVNGPDITRLNSAPSLTHQVITNYSITFNAFNFLPGHITATDEGVRRAVMAAIDPHNFNLAAYAGTGTIAKSTIRPGAECYDPKAKTFYPTGGPDAAKKILQDDGWTFSNGAWTKNGQTLSLTVVTTPLLDPGPAYIQQQLSAAGIQVNLQNLAGTAYGATVLAHNFDVALSRSTIVQPEAGFAQVYTTGPGSPLGSNVGGTIPDPTYNYYSGAAYENPGAGGCKDWALVQEYAIKHALVDPLVAPNFYLYSQKGIVVPPYSPDQSSYPIYYIHPAR
jgi:peptide/nickel transport system substrate-binding protein